MRHAGDETAQCAVPPMSDEVEIKLKTIETPRGKVVEAESLRSVLLAFNRILEVVNRNLDRLVSVLSELSAKLDRVIALLRSVDEKQDRMFEFLSELSSGEKTTLEIPRRGTEVKRPRISALALARLSSALRERGWAVVVGDADVARALVREYARALGRDFIEVEWQKLARDLKSLEKFLAERVVVLVTDARGALRDAHVLKLIEREENLGYTVLAVESEGDVPEDVKKALGDRLIRVE